MRRALLSIMTALTAFGTGATTQGRPAAPPAPPRAPAVLFEGARLIAGDGSAPIEASAFLVQDGRFTKVGRRGEVALPRGALRVDLTSKTVMPALVEVHAHLGYWRGLNASRDYFTRDQLLDDLRHLAYYGIAAVQSLGADRPEIAYPLRDELQAHPQPDLPVYLTTGPGLSLPDGGPPSPLKEAVSAVTTAEEARLRVRELAAHRVGCVKMWVDSRRGALPPPLYRAIIDEAHARGLKVIAHAHALADFKDLLRSGVDGFAHPTWRQTEVEPVDAELLALFRQHPQVFLLTTFWTPRNEIYGPRPPWIAEPILRETFSAEEVARLENPRTAADAPAHWAAGPAPRALKALQAAGVKFGLGTDMGGGGPSYFGFSSHVELESMVRAGMTPAAAIVAATKHSAEILGLNELGTIAPGKRAAFLVLDADPLDDIANTRRLSKVFLNGRELDRRSLRARWSSN